MQYLNLCLMKHDMHQRLIMMYIHFKLNEIPLRGYLVMVNFIDFKINSMAITPRVSDSPSVVSEYITRASRS